MRTGEKGIALIKKMEGCELEAYKCPAGIWTIGYGHTTAAGEPDVTEGMKITQREAAVILKQDLRKFEDAINRLVKVELSQSQFDALVSFVFNIGAGAFAKSTLLKKLNAGDYDAVPSELAKWSKAGKKVLKGLVARRAAEAALWSEDDQDRDDTTAGAVARDVPTVINKENISFAAGIAATGAAPLAEGDGPIQYALAAVIVIGFAVGLFLFIKRRGA